MVSFKAETLCISVTEFEVFRGRKMLLRSQNGRTKHPKSLVTYYTSLHEFLFYSQRQLVYVGSLGCL